MSNDYQRQFFDQLKAQIPSRTSMVNAVADLLDVSTDSAYRRIRGETDLSLNEALMLSREYGLSIDSLGGGESNVVIFRHGGLDFHQLEFQANIQALGEQLRAIHRAKEKMLYWFSRELPVFQLFHVPELLRFKSFFWAKSILGKDVGQFSFPDKDDEFFEIGQKIIHLYVEIPTLEILNEQFLGSTLRQIGYYFESGFFESSEDAFTLLDKLHELTLHIKSQAELGFKYPFGEAPNGEKGNFQLYYNEIIQSENQVYAELDGQQLTFIEHNVITSIHTADQKFCDYTKKTLDRVLSKSIPISSVSERVRNKFFNKTLQAIEVQKKKLQLS